MTKDLSHFSSRGFFNEKLESENSFFGNIDFVFFFSGSVAVDVTAEATVMVNVIAAACRESLRSGAVINLREYSQKHP